MSNNNWKETNADLRRGFFSGTGLLVGAVIVLLLVGGGLWGIKVLTADVKGAGDQRVATKGNASYRIAAYDQFFDRCAAVQSFEDQIKNLQTERETATGDRLTQIDSSITALRNTRATQIRQYNADAAKAGTRGEFRDSNLPYSLSVDSEETQCAA